MLFYITFLLLLYIHLVLCVFIKKSLLPMKLLFEHIQHEVGHFPPVAPDIIKPSAHIVGLSCMLHCDAEFYFLGISYLHTTHKSKKQKQGKHGLASCVHNCLQRFMNQNYSCKTLQANSQNQKQRLYLLKDL